MIQNFQFINMDVSQFDDFISRPGVQIIDVRTPDEYAEGHIRDAIEMDIFDPDFIMRAKDLIDKSRPVAIYCRSGRRSEEAAEILSREGYRVVNLKGGILAWEEAGLPIVNY